MRRRIIIILLFTIPIITAYAQEPVFIQYWYSTPSTMPALQSVDEMASLTLQSRMLHFGPGYDYVSTILAGKYPLINHEYGKGSIGLNYFQNQSTVPGQLLHQTINSTFAYSLHYNRFRGIAFSFDIGWVNKRIDLSNITTEELYLNGSIGETFSPDKLNYAKISSSILWFSKDRYRDINGYIGLSAFGLNPIKGSFLMDSTNASYLDRTIVILGGFRLYQNSLIAISPKFQHSSFNGKYLLKLGTDFNYSLANYGFGTERRNNSINFEFNYVFNRGFQLGMQLIRPAYIAGFGYNMDVFSGNGQFNFNNAFEFLLVLRKPVKTSSERRNAMRRRVNQEESTSGQKRIIMEHVQQQPVEPAEPSEPEVEQTVSDEPAEEIPEEPTHAIDTARFKKNVEEDFEWKSVVTLGEFTGIGFEFNSTEISESSMKVLKQLVDIINSDPKNKIVLIGHADAIGTRSVNEKISWERARSVAEVLVEMGIQEDQIILQAKGEDQPIGSNETPQGRAMNRRVEFFVIRTE